MKHSELLAILSRCLQGNKARLVCLVNFIVAIFITRTVNLVELATAVPGKTKITSRHMRLRRFLQSGFLTQERIAIVLWELFNFASSPVLLTLDRTNWRWGKSDINILTLAAVHKGLAVPLFCSFLSKKGNSNWQERINLLERFLKLFGKNRIASLVADREFVGKEWLGYLRDNNIPFDIRLKNNQLTETAGGKETTLRALFHGVKPGEKRSIKGRRRVSGHKLFLSGTMTQAGELLIIASNQSDECALERYAKRWQIETLFQALKSRGFNFEDTHVTKPERLNVLVCVLALSFSLAHLIGEWRHEHTAIKILKHGRPQHSLFRYGFDWFREKLINTCVTARKLAKELAESLDISRFDWCHAGDGG